MPPEDHGYTYAHFKLHFMAHVCPSTGPVYAYRDRGHKALCPLS